MPIRTVDPRTAAIRPPVGGLGSHHSCSLFTLFTHSVKNVKATHQHSGLGVACPASARASASPRTRRPDPPRAPAAPGRRSPARAPRPRLLLRSRSAPHRPPTSALDRGERALEAFLELHLRLPAELLTGPGRVERDVHDLARTLGSGLGLEVVASAQLAEQVHDVHHGALHAEPDVEGATGV